MKKKNDKSKKDIKDAEDIIGIDFVTVFGRHIPITIDSMEDAMGEFDRDLRQITLDPHPKYHKHLKSTLFHECLHAALAISGVHAQLSDELEESIVLCIENAFADKIDWSKF